MSRGRCHAIQEEGHEVAVLELTLVRHASTRLNEERRYQGRLDPPLSARGRMEAERLAERLRSTDFDRCLRSDARRCAETAALALPGTDFEVDTRLGEIDFGEWEGLTYDECSRNDPALAERWIDDPIRHTPPGGEPFTDFCDRVDRVIAELEREGSVLIVAHGGTIRRVVAHAVGLEWRHVALFQLSPGGITRLVLHPEGGHLRTLNETIPYTPCQA